MYKELQGVLHKSKAQDSGMIQFCKKGTKKLKMQRDTERERESCLLYTSDAADEVY